MTVDPKLARIRAHTTVLLAAAATVQSEAGHILRILDEPEVLPVPRPTTRPLPTLPRPNRVRAIGYVSTVYGDSTRKDPQKVLDDIKAWRTFYPDIEGIFFDETATKEEMAPLYGRYTDAAHAAFGNGSLVALNCGTMPPEVYLTTGADIIVAWEKEGAKGPPTLASWAKALDNKRFAALVQNAPAALLPLLPAAIANGYGGVYLASERWSTASATLMAQAALLEAARVAGTPAYMFVPAYFDPDRDKAQWDALFTVVRAHPTVSWVVILNPSSGPGIVAKDKYKRLIAQCEAIGTSP